MDVRRARWCALIFLTGLAFSGAAAFATETITYGYDPLGRLTGSATSGGSNNGVGTATCFDNAGNRTQYQTGTGTLATCPTPTPASEPSPPTPPPAPAQPPVAAAYTSSGPCATSTTVNVVTSDTDPGGNTPITVVSVRGTSNVSATVSSSSTVDLTGSAPGTDKVSYVVANSKGVTASGTVTYTTLNTGCSV